MKFFRRRLVILTLLYLICAKVLAATDWFPIPVDVWVPPYNSSFSRVTVDYIPLLESKYKWNICVVFPHVKDNYWRSVNFGIVQEVKRLGISMQLYQAGGYGNLPVQIRQIRKCVKDGADGVIIGAISYDGLNDLVSELVTEGIPVIDVVNGMSSTDVSAKSLVSFREMAFQTGSYLLTHLSQNASETRVAWFPGPIGAGWVEAGNIGFHDAIADSDIDVVAVRYGDTGIKQQTVLLEDVLSKHQDVEYIVGTAVTAEAAIKVLRKHNLQDKVKIVAYYATPAIYRAIKRGKVLAAPTDSAVIQGRVAADQLVRILENKKFYKHVGPKIIMLDKKNIEIFDRRTSFPPNGFNVTYTVKTIFSD